MLNCRACRTEIEVAGRAEDLSARAEVHLATCVACRALQTKQTSLRGLLGTLEPVGAPADFEFRLRARMAAQQRPAARFVLPRSLAVAVAACLVLAFATMLRRPAPPPVSGGEPLTAHGSAVVAPTSMDKPKQIEIAETGDASVGRDNKTTIVASAKIAAHARRHVLPVERIIAASLPARKSLGGEVEVNDLGVRGAAIVTEAALNPATLQSIPVSVAASAKPLKVFFKDTQGAERMISIEPVSFGARDLPGARGPVARVNAAVAQGVW